MFTFQGYTRFQLKLGGNYLDDIERIKQCRQVLAQTDVLIGDANTGNVNCVFIRPYLHGLNNASQNAFT
jgi:hypothetical protein